ncbi:hypothetical protein GCM10028808_73160 [Spirosoma migulaei]
MIPVKPGQEFSNPHPLFAVVRVSDGIRTGITTSTLDKKLLVNPANWCQDAQASKLAADPVNQKLEKIKSKLDSIYLLQKGEGLVPTSKTVVTELNTGKRPKPFDGKSGQKLPEHDLASATRLREKLTAKSPLVDAYQAYIAQLHAEKGTHKGLSRTSLVRWNYSLNLLLTYAKKTGTPLPTVDKITTNWARRYHTWLQTKMGGSRNPKPVSVGQASRFVLKISNVLDWMIDDDIISGNPISRGTWPKCPDKLVQFLDPEHVFQLLNLEWEGTQGVALWWFLLMCCTGLDYPDAVAYAKNRKSFEVKGRSGYKIVGKRNKPPHSEYHLPLLDEVDTLFKMIPNGPIIVTNTCINRYTKFIEEELGIDWRITNKTARKTFGCLMLAAGHRIADVSLMLGHSRISTTERYYVKVKSDSIDRAMSRVKVNIAQIAKGKAATEGQDNE